jgi:hypothetical protein
MAQNEMKEKNNVQTLMKRTSVSVEKHYSEYRDVLRHDFVYSCAYCSMTELEAQGIGFEIDHYKPRVKFKMEENNYENLMWSCTLCNRRKASYYPTKVQRQRGFFVLRPDKHNFSLHLKVQGQRVEALSTTGTFNIERLDLNRLNLRRLREVRKGYWKSRSYLLSGIRSLNSEIDRLPPSIRQKLLRRKRQIDIFYSQLSETTEELMMELARSPLLDTDHEEENRKKERRKYLRSVQAITEDAQLPSKPGRSRSKKKTSMKRRGKSKKGR